MKDLRLTLWTVLTCVAVPFLVLVVLALIRIIWLVTY